MASSNSNRTETLILAVADKAPPKIAPYLRKAAPVLAAVANALDKAMPHITKAIVAFSAFIDKMPNELLYSIFGFCLCFFGGNFPLVIAACEAFNQCGFQEVKGAALDMYDEYCHLKVKNDEDNILDLDGDGVADVDQIPPTELVARKVAMVLRHTKDPERVELAIGHFGTAFAGVIATLKLQFARTISLGLSIGQTLLPLATKYLKPILERMLPADYHQWITIGLAVLCKSIAVSIAWTIQRIISTVQCASRGGLMFAHHGLKYLHLIDVIHDIDLETTYLDEAVGWSVAALGIWFQLSNFFGLPFPLNVITLPVSMLEGTLAWLVTE